MEFIFSQKTCSDSNFNQKFDYDYGMQGLNPIVVSVFAFVGERSNDKNNLQTFFYEHIFRDFFYKSQHCYVPVYLKISVNKLNRF